MPFVSKAQQGFMFAKHPEIAKRWAEKYGVKKDLPYHVAANEAVKRMKKK